MGIKKIKISSLPLADTLEGLHTIGVNALNKSVKVGLEFVKDAADNANNAASAANNASKSADTATKAANDAAAAATTAAASANESSRQASSAATQATEAAENAQNAANTIEEKIQEGIQNAKINAETVDGLHLWKGSEAEYNALPSKDANTLYITTE